MAFIHIVGALALALSIGLTSVASAQSPQGTASLPAAKLDAARDYVATLKPTALMVVLDGKTVASWGDTSRKINVASVRKSLLGALYGIAVADGRIDLGSTLATLGIDDKAPALTETEKQATVRDLLMARSGIYHVAAHETADIRRKRPRRGSHAPGSFWYYNNWDFNALGTIYRQRTGEDIFESFARRIAGPVGMQDFTPRDGSYVLEKASIHPAYPFTMSARDLARFGQLFLGGGRWNGKQIVPAQWVDESTAAYSATDRASMGYGYLWWTLNPAIFGNGAALASGYGGQAIAVIPSRHLVVVQVVDRKVNPEGIRTRDFVKLLRHLADTAR